MDITQLIEKYRKPALITLALVLFYTLAGFVLLPKYLQSKLPELIETETGRKTSLELVEFNPYSLELSLQGFSMQEKDLQTFVSFKELYTNVQVWSSIRHLTMVLQDLKLEEPFVRIESLKDGQYNFSDLSSDETQQETEKSDGIFPIIINNIDLINGKFVTIDLLKKEPVNKVINDINFSLDNFSTLPEKGADLGFSLALNGNGRLDWHGEFGINPIYSKGKVKVEGLQLVDIWTLFLQDIVDYKWVAGTQSIVFKYELSYPQEELFFNLTEGRLLTKDLTYASKEDNKEILTLPHLLADGITFDLNKQIIDIEKIESRDADFDLWFDQSGQLNFQTAFIDRKTTLETNIKQHEQDVTLNPWTVNILDLAINAAKINYSDKRKQQAVLFNIAALDLGFKNTRLKLAETAQVTANQGYLNLQESVLKTDTDTELINVPSIKITEVDFNLLDKKLSIKAINTSDAYIKAWLSKDGELNYQSLFATEAETTQVVEQNSEPTNSETHDTPWLLELAEFKIDNYAIQFKDNTTATPVSLNLSELNFSLTEFNTKQGTRLPISFNSRFNQHGLIKISGNSVIEPFQTELKIAISKIGIASFEPYINQGAHLDIIGGDFNTQGHLTISKVKQTDLKLQYKGQIDIKKLHTRDQILKQDFLKWQKLTLAGIDYNLQPGELNIKSIHLDQPYARVTIKEDKTTNINDVIVADKTDQQNTPAKEVKPVDKAGSPFVYKIDKINISKGESDFSDYSLILPFVVHLNDLQGDINSISSNQKTQTKVDLKGKAYDLSPVAIQGSFNAGLDDLDIAMHFKSFPLPFISPYMVEFSGDKIEKGKMSLDLRYQVKNKKLNATNELIIDQFELGEKVDNPDAVKLPLRLASVLLKDKDGRINISMPVKGSTDDPEFNVRDLVLDIFINFLTKVVTAPFTAIASFLDSDADFSVVTFAPGSSEINTDQGKKLNELATALVQKQELSLEVKGMAYTNQDWPAMNEIALKDKLKQIHSDELKKAGKTRRAEYIELSEDEYQRLLADLFILTFPDLAKRSFFGTPQLTYPDMGEFYTVAKNMLTAMIAPDENKLSILALTRARNVASYMVERGTIEQTRIFILDGKVVSEAENNQLNTDLSLIVQ